MILPTKVEGKNLNSRGCLAGRFDDVRSLPDLDRINKNKAISK